MKNHIIEYVKKAIGEKIILKEYFDIDALPLFIKEDSEILEGEVLGQYVLFVIPKRNLKIKAIINITTRIKKHYIRNIDVCYVFSEISDYKRKELIKEKIPFLFINRQLYFPFVAMEYNDISSKITVSDIELFTPCAQLIYLYLLYNFKEIDIVELVEIVKMTEMSVSRAIKELVSANLLTVNIGGKTNRKKAYKPVAFKDYFEYGYKYLKSPIKKVVYIDQYDSNLLMAGESALSIQSMLIAPVMKCYALYWKSSKKITTIGCNETENVKRLELWSYDPNILAKENYVDIISLKLSLQNEKDERINDEIQQVIKESKWYKG